MTKEELVEAIKEAKDTLKNYLAENIDKEQEKVALMTARQSIALIIDTEELKEKHFQECTSAIDEIDDAIETKDADEQEESVRNALEYLNHVDLCDYMNL